jgi:Ni/Co efflux regulator RcnB
MKTQLVATLALFLCVGPVAAAQSESGQSVVPGTPGVAAPKETGGGKPPNATSHTYQKGERLSLAHGYYDEIVDWKGHHLTVPAEGDHWVYYGDYYLLARIDTGVIIEIVKASWSAGQG